MSHQDSTRGAAERAHLADLELNRDLNVVVLRGEVVSDPSTRELPSGSTVVQFDVRTRLAGEPSAGANPVALHDPPPAVTSSLVAGTEVVVVGCVRRRFFRVGGATQSRTEVVAHTVVPTRRRRQVERALAVAVESLTR